MPQVHCYLPKKTVELLEKIRVKSGHSSLSKAMKEMIDLGVHEFINKENDTSVAAMEKERLEKEEKARNQHTLYLHKILSLNTEIFRCVYDKNKLQEPQKNMEEKIVTIKKKVDEFKEGWVFPPL